MIAASCGGGDNNEAAPMELRLVTHDSFNVSEDVLDAFGEETGITVRIVKSGDAGAALNQAILTKNNPRGDVFFGVDNTFLTRALDEGLFLPYESPRLSAVADAFALDDEHRVTPIDHGDVCINYDKEYFAASGTAPPESFDDLAADALRGQLVVEHPATSSPGLAFLLGTIAHFGEDGWKDYWRRLRENDVEVASGWEEAYYQSFSGGAGEGTRPLVVSYASSPPAEVVFAEPQPDEAPTGVVTATCFEQIEFAGILDGTEHEEEAQQLIDFMLSVEFQEDMPLQMFVFPVVDDAELPAVFAEHAATVDDPLRLPASEIGRNRDEWIDEWTAIVLP
jgi:thiamine transport system substrate-binding protein